MATLTIFRGDAVVKRQELGERDVRIGRGQENDVVLEDAGKAVSRFHAELRYDNGSYVLLDLNSQNGVWVDGRRIQRESLRAGTAITIGPYRVLFEQDAIASEPSAAPLLKATVPVASPSDTLVARGPSTTAAMPAPVKRAAPRKAAPVPGDAAPGLIGWMLRLPRPVLFGTFAAVCLLIIVAGQIFNSEEPGLEPVAAGPLPADRAPAAPSNADQIATHLTAAQDAFAQGRLDEAKHRLQQLLLIDREHVAALELLARTDQALRNPTTTTAGPVTPPPTVSGVPGTLTSDAKPERAPPFRPRTPAVTPGERRARELRDRLAAAQAATDRGEFGQAQHVVTEILKEDPGFPDAAALLGRVKEGERQARVQSAQRELAEARKLEAAGELQQALAGYQRTDRIDGSLEGVTGAIAQLRQKMRAVGEDAFRRARQYDAIGRIPEALALYDRAVQMLPEDHANRPVALDRITALKVLR